MRPVKVGNNQFNAVIPFRFQKNFSDVSLRYMLYQSAKEGKDFLTWTNADTQFARYYGGKQPEPEPIRAKEMTVFILDGIPTLSIESAGKEITAMKAIIHLEKHGKVEEAEKIRQAALEAMRLDEGQRVDLSEETELAMPSKKYQHYDRDMVIKMNEFLKKQGVKERVEKLNIKNGTRGEFVWGVRITPELRRILLEGGVPIAKVAEETTVA